MYAGRLLFFNLFILLLMTIDRSVKFHKKNERHPMRNTLYMMHVLQASVHVTIMVHGLNDLPQCLSFIYECIFRRMVILTLLHLRMYTSGGVQ
jgi:hypothetical protein